MVYFKLIFALLEYKGARKKFITCSIVWSGTKKDKYISNEKEDRLHTI